MIISGGFLSLQLEKNNFAKVNMKQTKIVASVSDRRCSVDFIRQLFDAGVNVVRMNTAHADEEGIKTIIRNVREVSPHLGILIDTKGPEIRTTYCEAPIEYKTGEIVKVVGCPGTDTTHDKICLSYEDIAKDLSLGKVLLFDDGALQMTVTAIEGNELTARVDNDGKLGSRKSVNVPGVHIALPALTEKDVKNINLAIDEDIDFIAHSFVRSAADVKAVQDVLDERGSDIKIISKIENQEGVDNIDEIIAASYGIMIARGDLGIEVPIAHIPSIQRQIIHKCILSRKPVIVATQMLHTMIDNPRPTRAEVTDIANAIYSRTDALMLSGETASGKYPIEAVKTMANIAEHTERDMVRTNEFAIPMPENCTLRQYMSYTAIEATSKLDVKGIITDCGTGETARLLASFRGPHPVLALCYTDKLQRWLNLSYGVTPTYFKEKKSTFEMFNTSVRMLHQKGFVKYNDRVAYLSATEGNGGIETNMLEINKVEDILSK